MSDTTWGIIILVLSLIQLGVTIYWLIWNIGYLRELKEQTRKLQASVAEEKARNDIAYRRIEAGKEYGRKFRQYSLRGRAMV